MSLSSLTSAVPAGRSLLQHPQANGRTRLEGEWVDYLLHRARRRSVGMRITEQGLVVTAPTWLGAQELDSILQRKGAWIVRKLHEQHSGHAERSRALLRWHHGAVLPYLGGHVSLRLTGTPGMSLPRKLPGAVLSGVEAGILEVPLPPEATPGQIRHSVQCWFQEQAMRHYAQRVAFFACVLNVHCSALRLSSARTRWGSATARGTIRLHWGLMHFSPEIVDYVVVHELCHLREMNHSPRFWRLVESVLPDYLAQRRTLRALRLPDWNSPA